MFEPPDEPAVKLIVTVPAGSVPLVCVVLQVLPEPVDLNVRLALMTVPFTLTLAGRLFEAVFE